MPKNKSVSSKKTSVNFKKPFRMIRVVLYLPNQPLTKDQALAFVENFIADKLKRNRSSKNKSVKKKVGIRSHSSCTAEQATHDINLDAAADALVDLTNWQTQGPVLETTYSTALSNAVDSGIALDQCLNT